MEDATDHNTTALLAIKHDVPAMLQTPQARANVITEAA